MSIFLGFLDRLAALLPVPDPDPIPVPNATAPPAGSPGRRRTAFHKLQEITRALADGVYGPVDLALIDDELSPGQQRHIKAALGIPVFDCSAVSDTESATVLRIRAPEASIARWKNLLS